jgi:hypothetical protein
MLLIPWIDPGLFTQYMWDGSTIYSVFGFHLRYTEAMKYKDILQLYATGYCKAEELFVRNKLNHYAVMFEKDDKRWWQHFRGNEFMAVYYKE